MAIPSVTYTFTNGSEADGTQVSQNFTDLINSLTDGTKSLTIASLSLAGSFVPNGTLGASIIPAANNLYAIGSTSFGISKAYFGNGTFTMGLKAGALSGSFSLIGPASLPAAQSFATIDSSGNIATGRAYSVGQQISTSCGSFTTTSGAAVAVTNLSVTITTSGRPVMLNVMPDNNGTNFSSFGCSAGQSMSMQMLRGATVLAIQKISDTATSLQSPIFLVIDPVAAGTYTYSVKALVSGGTGTITNCQLVAFEL